VEKKISGGNAPPEVNPIGAKLISQEGGKKGKRGRGQKSKGFGVRRVSTSEFLSLRGVAGEGKKKKRRGGGLVGYYTLSD